MFTVTFWQAAGERAIKTFVQTFAVVFAADGLDFLSVDFKALALVAFSAAVASIATSLLSILGSGDGPSLTGSEVLSPILEDDHGVDPPRFAS